MFFQRLCILLSLVSFCLVQSSFSQPDKMQPRDLPIVGGYTSRDWNDPEVQSAAHFAVHLYFSDHLKDIPSADITFKVYRAAVQVVAGLNYKLSILTYVHGKCQGSLEDVVVYRDLNQTYSVSHWGTLKQCDDIVFPE